MLGRFNIAYATNTMARFSMAPREGHLTAAKRIFGYLARHPKGEIILNPSKYDHTEALRDFEHYNNWKEFYPDAEEEIPQDRPQPSILKVQLTIYVDADHAHDIVTRRSVSGILLFINKTPVKWISKRQKTVETSTYGSELDAARLATELAIKYRYILRMLRFEPDGPVTMFGDNKSVVLNTTLPSSILKKKHNAIAYHRVREAIAGKIIQFVHIPSQDNIADVLTKPLTRATYHKLVRPILFERSGMNDQNSEGS
jgi:hypothetical protein